MEDTNMEIGFLTGNMGKVKEISKWLEGTGHTVVKLDERFIEVQADTLEDVIIEGMFEAVSRTGDMRHLMKDDSGLFIDSLNGFPGVYSAYVQKTIGNDGILKLLKDYDDRTARFRTVIGLYIPKKGVSMFRGECIGTISQFQKGNNGFGYDPIFIPDGENLTFAEMTTEKKNSMSHRIRAMKGMIDYLSMGDK